MQISPRRFQVHWSFSVQNDKVVCKAELKKILCQLLGFLTPDTFQVIPRQKPTSLVSHDHRE